MGGWKDGWMEGWMDGKDRLRIAYSNQKNLSSKLHKMNIGEIVAIALI